MNIPKFFILITTVLLGTSFFGIFFAHAQTTLAVVYLSPTGSVINIPAPVGTPKVAAPSTGSVSTKPPVTYLSETGAVIKIPPAAGTPSSAAPANGGFVALTNLPILQNLTTAPDLGAFLNAIYKYCVGLAAVLAVIQIMRAGIMYMGGDSVTEVKQARALISTAILGLVLVLSPVIVFSIIDQRILNLNIGSDFAALNIPSDSSASASASTPNTADGTVAPNGACTTDTNCQNQNGLDYTCQPEGNGTCTYNPAASPTVVSCTLDNTVADQCSDCPSHMCSATGANGTVYCALDNTTASSCAACPSKTCSATVSTGP